MSLLNATPAVVPGSARRRELTRQVTVLRGLMHASTIDVPRFVDQLREAVVGVVSIIFLAVIHPF
jgi:hypothetical protein